MFRVRHGISAQRVTSALKVKQMIFEELDATDSAIGAYQGPWIVGRQRITRRRVSDLGSDASRRVEPSLTVESRNGNIANFAVIEDLGVNGARAREKEKDAHDYK